MISKGVETQVYFCLSRMPHLEKIQKSTMEPIKLKDKIYGKGLGIQQGEQSEELRNIVIKQQVNMTRNKKEIGQVQ